MAVTCFRRTADAVSRAAKIRLAISGLHNISLVLHVEMDKWQLPVLEEPTDVTINNTPSVPKVLQLWPVSFGHSAVSRMTST